MPPAASTAREGAVEVLGAEQHQDASRAGLAADAEAADLAVTVGGLDAGVVGAVVVEPPAEGLPVERLGARRGR